MSKKAKPGKPGGKEKGKLLITDGPPYHNEG